MADIKHRVGGEEYGTWTIPKKQIKEGYKAARGYEIDNDLLDDMSSIKYYSYTNKDTQEVEVRRVDGDVFVGKLFTNTSSTKPNTPFTVDKNASGRIDIEAAIFNIKAAQTTLKEQTKKGMIKDVTTNGIPDQEGSPPTPEEAENYVDETLNNNFEDNNPNSPGFTDDKEPSSSVANIIDGNEDNINTRNDFGKEALRYPSKLSSTQDTLKFQMIKYVAKGFKSNGNWGGIDRDKAGVGERDILGTVILPIPGGIKDSATVGWGEDNMNALTMAAAGFAEGVIEEGPSAADREIGSAINALKKTGMGSAKSLVSSAFTAAAINKDFKSIMARSTGQILNPNMELLFTGPSLRPFSFNFLLAPRSKSEAMEVMKIIRFFKQGMAPIRSKANLFLKSPHTFQLQYRHKDDNHPYLNSFKECALESCEVNYTPEQSYSTYEDGVMTAYTLSLGFKELEPIYNDDYGNSGDLPSNLNLTSTTGVDVQNLTNQERDKLAGKIVPDISGGNSYVFDAQTQAALDALADK